LPDLEQGGIRTTIIAIVALATGSLLVIGFLTPLGGTMAVLTGIVFLFLHEPTAGYKRFDGNPADIELIITAIATALLGPRAFSIDARLFGRRKIIIPRSSSED
jgi:uncharacterized membrane protein YphA (DoxX/SURF4 family)